MLDLRWFIVFDPVVLLSKPEILKNSILRLLGLYILLLSFKIVTLESYGISLSEET